MQFLAGERIENPDPGADALVIGIQVVLLIRRVDAIIVAGLCRNFFAAGWNSGVKFGAIGPRGGR